ncbi:preprotein translocase subunit SecA [Candidatus Uhrbacteria bacterium RIFCSPHIGHO2_12_FULL_60_25]|uniref:Protein translocase subunit SecA n=1 Tax=Candidatus Uhrbacteria bacterium RIFCSPHIGHO2_12_FULL_60_25 TaxID=1802399 RepID=A0A1F7UMZ2_9BACT|nr:MAG: preprotein translocase subunit SecA [Candidatus Uhrbacteria bacterium RIFCSPHIGHO2_02_FULL_60_44]OGL79068.1 MAG: preprotein translocase subunit SecA [Candidatus Uhrbacteria bacterium RIFCSPHIGHO2_12_FULL_60_25]
MMSLLKVLFGDANEREVKRLQPLVDRINALEKQFEGLSLDALKTAAGEIRERLAKGEGMDDVLPDAFGLAREATKRTLKQRQYNVQLTGGLALHRGMIAEMRTGEGKTLTAVAPIVLNALTGKGVHLVTVNDYLARRDAVWMGQAYHALGLSVGCIQHESGFLYDPTFKREPEHDEERDATGSFRVDMDYLRPCSRREAYAADITYGTNNEFGFDYLRDNMVGRVEEMVQRELHYAIVDEVDSILIDEARTPLIISGPAAEPAELYYRFADLVPRLNENEDYKVDEKHRAATLTESGITKMEGWLNVENLYTTTGMRMVHHLEQALRAHALYKKDRDYVVKDGEVIIVDEFTGRLMIGRRYSEGLHQAIEAKERVNIQRESITLATITFQNYFRLYEKLAGMTGTAATEAEEFHKIYKLEVLTIPTNKTAQRSDLPDRVYKTEIGKFRAVVDEIKVRHAKGQPMLVGTVSIEKNELLSSFLHEAGVPHEVLNAKNHEREGAIIAQAGRKGAVTIATNMAGRGVDIILGGNPPDQKEADDVRAVGGLHVIGTERHESRRIDNQLRGRAARQGDQGSTQFFISTEDDLMRIFGSDRMKKMMDALKVPDDMPIEHKILSKSIESAQHRVEGHNFDIRKHLLEYDDVLNKHRSVVYRKRRDVLELSKRPTVEGERPLKAKVLEAIEGEAEQLVMFHTGAEEPTAWDLDALTNAVKTMLPPTLDVSNRLTVARTEIEGKMDLAGRRTALIETIMGLVKEAYTGIEENVGDSAMMAEIEKAVFIRSIDDAWIDHLENIDHLRHGIGLQGYGQRDPLVEYKREAYRLFNELMATIGRAVTATILRVQVSKEAMEQELQRQQRPMVLSGPTIEATSGSVQNAAKGMFDNVGRNELCPCGSGKKFKKCHGA